MPNSSPSKRALSAPPKYPSRGTPKLPSRRRPSSQSKASADRALRSASAKKASASPSSRSRFPARTKAGAAKSIRRPWSLAESLRQLQSQYLRTNRYQPGTPLPSASGSAPQPAACAQGGYLTGPEATDRIPSASSADSPLFTFRVNTLADLRRLRDQINRFLNEGPIIRATPEHIRELLSEGRGVSVTVKLPVPRSFSKLKTKSK